jgi:TIR domain
MTSSGKFFISYASPDRGWAEWVAWVLEDNGATVKIQVWDFVPGSNFVLEMQRAVKSAGRTIAILSPHYLKSRFTAPEWAAVFCEDPEGMKRKLVPVRVLDCAPDGLQAPIVYVDLVGLDETSARKRLVDGIYARRSKPDRKPTFPGEGERGCLQWSQVEEGVKAICNKIRDAKISPGTFVAVPGGGAVAAA